MIIDKIISNKDKLELEVCIMEPKGKPKGIIQISHGMAEHKERYYDFMEFLINNGYVCVIHDHRGHGASINKTLGDFNTEDINYIVDDLYQVTCYIKEKYKDLDIILFSHSMGTLISRCYIKKYDNYIKKVIICGPPTYNSMSNIGIVISTILKPFYKNRPNKILNYLTFNSYNKGISKKNGWICSNTDTVNEYNNDELCGYVFTTNGFINLYKLMKSAFNKKEYRVLNPNLYIFLIAGELDPVIQNVNKFNELKTFLEEAGYKNIKSKLYKNMRHELLNEKDNKSVYKDILEFIEKE